jgi:hypothetical protein
MRLIVSSLDNYHHYVKFARARFPSAVDMASDTAIMESLDPFLHDEQEGLFLPPDKPLHINPMLMSLSSKNR